MEVYPQLQKGTVLKDMVDDIDGYAHKLTLGRHNKKVNHLITIRLKNNVSPQSLNCLTTPLRFLKDNNGEILTTNDNTEPETTQTNKFDFYVKGDELEKFLNESDQLNESDLEENEIDNDVSQESVKKSSLKKIKRDADIKERVSGRESPIVLGLDDTISVKPFRANK